MPDFVEIEPILEAMNRIKPFGVSKREIFREANLNAQSFFKAKNAGRVLPSTAERLVRGMNALWPEAAAKTDWLDRQLSRLARGDGCETAGKGRIRPCLTCSRSFESQHIGNRMCDDCRRSAASLGAEMI